MDVGRLPKSRKRLMIELYLAEAVWHNIEILPYDEVAADWHADQRARLTIVGRSPSFIDGQIAAISKINNLILVTRNKSDFKVFSTLTIQNWHEKY